MKNKLIAALKIRYPELKEYQAKKCVDKYVYAICQEIITCQILFPYDTSELVISTERAKLSAGRIDIDGKSQWIVPLMQENTSTKLLHITFRGNIGKNSRAVFNLQYKALVMEELQNLTIELNPTHLLEIDEKSNNDVIVDPKSLLSYLIATKRALAQTTMGQEYKEKLTRCIRIGIHLTNTLQEKDGIFFLREYWERTDSGRMYGHGLSLQRIYKEVRHAALGNCHKYDFKACSYALMTGLALELDPTLNVEVLKDYIKNREQIRKDISKEIGISEEWVKNIFTSLGFGASVKDNPYSSIRDKLGAEKFALLAANLNFATIKDQLDTVRKIISHNFKEDDFEFAGRMYSSIDCNSGKKRTKNQKLAWIYQALESLALGTFIDECRNKLQIEPLLTTHDCLYFKTKLPLSFFQDMHFYFSRVFPLLTFEHEAIIPIHAFEDHNKRKTEIDIIQLEHKRFILEQERIAKDYIPLNVSIDTVLPLKKQVQTPWGMIDEDLWISNHSSTEVYYKGEY